MSNYSHKCSCLICHKEFNNVGGLGSHYNNKHLNTSASSRTRISYSCLSCKCELKDVSSLTSHHRKCNSTPILYSNCTNCNKPIYNKHAKYCSRTCAVHVSNKTRSPRTDESNKKISIGIRNYNKSIGKINHKREFEESISGNFSKVYFRKCKRCNSLFTTSKTGKLICMACTNKDYSFYRFKFNLFHYPDLFDLKLLSEVGFVSFGGKRGGKLNMQGLSRDHRVSVSEAIANNYDQYYITHPLNCELMTQSKNSSKNRKSSIMYNELVLLIDSYDDMGVH